MRVLFAAFCLIPLLSSAETIEAFDLTWEVQQASDWSVEGDVLLLEVPGQPPAGLPRRPQKYAVASTQPFRSVVLEAEVRRNEGSLIIVYAFQDESHYNYVHISPDTAERVNVHNGMFHVFGGERVRISPLDGPASLPTEDWVPVKLVFDGDTGRCYVTVNGKRNPSLEAVDLSLRWGRIGLGSFNHTGSFRHVRITGEPREADTPAGYE